MFFSKLKEYVSHPGFLSLLIWAGVICFIPPLFNKYILKSDSKQLNTTHNTYYLYNDLDYDGNSETISIDLNDKKQTQIVFLKGQKVIEQYSVKYNVFDIASCYIADYNNDRCKELYVFTMNQDSIFLNIIDPLKARKKIVSDRYIDRRHISKTSSNTPVIIPVEMIKSHFKSNLDFLFFITTGFSKQPRRVYRYNIDSDSLLKSPESGAAINRCQISHSDPDSIPEIVISTSANGNLPDSFPYTDQFSWLMVLNDSLKFLFPPVKMTKYPTVTWSIPYKTKHHTRLVAFNNYFGDDEIENSLSLYDMKGKLLHKKPVTDIENTFSSVVSNMNNKGKTFFLIKNRKTDVEEMDSSFNILRHIKIPGILYSNSYCILDADGDGRKELIFTGADQKSLIILRDNFMYPVIWNYGEYFDNPVVSKYLKVGARPQLYFQSQDDGFFVTYMKNPLYILKYPFYLLIYLLILLFVSGIYFLQAYRLRLKQETEQKVAGLQMKAIKNQIDPHFTLNMVNAIGSLYATETDRSRADYIFGKYAKMIRETVVSSDKIIVTLEDEIEFVRTFLDLELFRYDNSFTYTINLENGVNPMLKIPRMLIYTFVENSVKYGIRNNPEKGILKISAAKNSNMHVVTIEDNGPGIDLKNKEKGGTGKGLMIFKELIELYYKLEKVKITHSIINLADEDHRKSGTKVIIKIPQTGSQS